MSHNLETSKLPNTASYIARKIVRAPVFPVAVGERIGLMQMLLTRLDSQFDRLRAEKRPPTVALLMHTLEPHSPKARLNVISRARSRV
jgi:hypothetical protein